ncbi:hypothetical protein [Streptomyces tauricus]|uniref:hypothetical protein n=1 Tax=Streptomyces tauricus TaxID=68274 RepID=UPI00341F96F8
MATTQGTSAPTAALALLVFPGLADLSEQQVRGTACVWSGTPISTATAVDLGERKIRLLDGAISMFPRGCHGCTAEAARTALLAHAPVCEQCVDDADRCDTGRALRQIVRECRR